MPVRNRKTTWDGKPVSHKAPYGATVIVFRTNHSEIEYLVLHRTYNGPDYEGEWAWTPPSGARYPGEPVKECAQRELREETGLALPVEWLDDPGEDWITGYAQAEGQAEIQLSREHDRFAWVELEKAVRLCRPERVGKAFEHVDRQIRHNHIPGAGRDRR